MYTYKYVEVIGQQMFQSANHRETIDQYSKEGWRFVTAIPIHTSGYGVVKTFDLVFEKAVESQ